MKSKLGIQTQWDSGEAFRYNREVKPAAVMGINVAKASWWSQIASDNPGVKRIYRHHPNSDEIPLLTKWHVDPERAALDFVAFLRGHLGDTLNEFELICGDNEFILSEDHEPPERIALADRYTAAFVREADMFLGKGVCVGNFNVGHWGPETVNYFPRTLTAIQSQAVQGERLSYFCFHEYNWSTLRDDTHWYTGKFLRAMPPILERYPNVKCMITEVGIDKASRHVGEHAGWRKAHSDINIAVDMYCGDYGLAWYNNLLNQTDYVAAALIFGCGMGDPWRPMGFDIMNSPDDTVVLDRIKTYPTDGGDEMRVVDRDYNERDLAWAEREYNIKFDRAEGQTTWRLVELWEKTGISCHNTQVWDQDGNPVDQQRVAWYWPDAPQFPFPSEHDWRDHFEVGLTNANGDVCPGMGTGAYYDPATECGPHEVWIHDTDRPSDRLRCVGMRGMTFHDHLDCVFQLVDSGGDGNGDGDGNGNGDCGWTIAVGREAKHGARILIGKGLPIGTSVIVSFHGWSVTVAAGSKPEYGPGAWLVDIWNAGVYLVSVLGCEFEVKVGHDEIVTMTFTEGEPLEPEARVLTDWMPKSDAEDLLDGLEVAGYTGFSLEDRTQ